MKQASKIKKNLQKTSPSQGLFEAAQACLVGGVNSPARSFSSVSGQPPFIHRGEGSHIHTVDEKRLIDYVLSWGPLLLGHSDPDVVAAIRQAAEQGTSFGAPCQAETTLANLVKTFYPSIDLLRFVNSGTEATMSAIRLARGYTKRSKILKFNGCYHGHVDSLLVQPGSAAIASPCDEAAGIPAAFTNQTLVCDFNNEAHVKKCFKEHGSDIAAVIVEPVCGNMGLILPKDGFLSFLRKICTENDSLLIFDEVLCGFRISTGGAQTLYSVTPDLTTLGKVIGGGMPCGAYGGRKEIMEQLAPLGHVYQAGTLSGNPVAMACGIATLKKIKNSHAIQQAIGARKRLCEGFSACIQSLRIPVTINTLGTMFTVFFNEKKPSHFQEAKQCDLDAFTAYHRQMLERNIYLPPSQFEANFLSCVHSNADIEESISAFEESMMKLYKKGS